jgi:Flp pilus assembly protein TadD
VTVEESYPELAAALSRLTASPSAESEICVAQAYARHNNSDKALEHFERAATLDPANSDAWDGLARVWRDWGFPNFGLGNAYRAVHAAPRSPTARNTLGTILQVLGRGPDARAQFALAVKLDPNAVYARNNLCYSWLLDGQVETGFAECEGALAIQPGLAPMQNNMALARAVVGDLAGATDLFQAAGGDAVAQYNIGVIYLSQRRYMEAAAAFERAAALQPSALAQARARQARQHATQKLDDERPDKRR